MTEKEAIENAIKDIRKHLEENEYCKIEITRKDKVIKSGINIYEGDFETVITKAGTFIEIGNEVNHG